MYPNLPDMERMDRDMNKQLAKVPGEEEAYLAFTLNAFKEIVEKYGAKEVIKQLDDSTFWKITTACEDGYDSFGRLPRS